MAGTSPIRSLRHVVATLQQSRAELVHNKNRAALRHLVVIEYAIHNLEATIREIRRESVVG